MLKRLTLLAITLFIFLSSNGQNLVPNPGFEKYNSCPSAIYSIFYDPSYTNFPIVPDWVAPLKNGTPDYFHSCATFSTGVHVPETQFGYQNARTGQAYVGMIAWEGFWQNGNWVADEREYMQCRLLQPLAAGKRYCVTFYVNPTTTTNFARNYVAIDNIGVNFSANKTDQSSGFSLSLPYHVMNPSGTYLSDTSNWIKVSGIYTATGGERWMTVGVFNGGAPGMQPITPATPNNAIRYRSYMFFDDFSVVPMTAADTAKTSIDTVVCDKNNINLQLKSNAYEGDYKWSTGASSPDITVNGLGTYWCRTVTSCQVQVDTFHIRYDPAKKLSIGNDTGNCFNQPMLLKMAGNFTNISWSTGETSPAITVNKSGSYVLNALNDCGWQSDTINIYIQPPTEPPLTRDTAICQFTEQPILNVTGQNLRWYQSANSIIGNTFAPYINTQEPGPDAVYVTQTIGKCESERVPVNITVRYQPREALPDVATMCQKYPQMIGGDYPGVTYKWSNGSNACCILPQQEGLYKVAVSNECGTYIDTIRIFMSLCDTCIAMPNAFTPDFDGRNDKIKPIVTCPISDYQIMIFNRWGNKVFESRDVNEGWTGTYQGIMCQNGAYVYTLLYRSESTKRTIALKGTINLIR